MIRRLPLLRPALVLIARVYAARGLLGVPAVLLADGPYAAELRGRMPLMIVSSLACLVLALCYAAGGAAGAPGVPEAPGHRAWRASIAERTFVRRTGGSARSREPGVEPRPGRDRIASRRA